MGRLATKASIGDQYSRTDNVLSPSSNGNLTPKASDQKGSNDFEAFNEESGTFNMGYITFFPKNENGPTESTA